VTIETVEAAKSAVTDKRGIEQISAGAVGLLVCGLVTAVIWFFAIKSVTGETIIETGAIDCETSATYGVAQNESCSTP